MDLRARQDLLARLFTDPDFRRAHDKHESEFSVEEVNDVERFAESLFRKRLHEVEKLIPITRQALVGSLESEFRSFYPTFDPKTIKRHLEEAIAFCRYLQRQPSIPEEARHAANFEAAKLTFYGYERSFALCRPSPRSIAGESRRRISFTLWIRLGKHVRYFIR